MDLSYHLNLEESDSLTSHHKNLAEKLVAKEYLDEELGDATTVFSDDKGRVSGKRLDKDNAYIYWLLPKLLMVQGSKPEVETTLSDLYSSLGLTQDQQEAYATLRPVEFDKHFLLWLVYRDYIGKDIGKNVSLHSISEITIKGGRDFFGESAQVTESTDILRSTAFIEGLFKNKLPVHLKAIFKVGGQNLMVDISKSGRIHILSKEDINSSTKLERVMIGLHFVSEFTTLRQDWEFYDPDKKYVPPTFIEELNDVAKDQGAEITFRREIIPELLDKRGEDLEDWDLDF
ncbi:hypothetical protein A4G99_03695 [Haladaptatus sp. R4]|nr:hypothetical protein A4G99_03695 [Haladaptatus sp. R4]